MLAEKLKELYDIKHRIKAAIEYLYPDENISDDFSSYAKFIEDFEDIQEDYSEYAVVFDTDSDEISYRNVCSYPMQENVLWDYSDYDFSIDNYKSENVVIDFDYSFFPITKKSYIPYGIAPVDDNVICLKQYNLEKIKSGGEYVLCFKYIPNCKKIENFVKGNVTNLKLAFNNFKGEEICETLDLSGVTDISYLFSYCVNLKKVPNLVNTESVNSIEAMFRDCSSLENIDLTPLQNTTGAKSLKNMFFGCSNLQNIDLSPLQNTTESVNTIESMFRGCSNLQNIDLSPLQNTTKITTLGYIVADCSNLQNIDLSPLQNNKNISNSAYNGLYGMFYNCTSLESINFGEWRLENITVNYSDTFYNCRNLKYITCTQNMYEILSRTTDFTNYDNVTWYILDKEPDIDDSDYTLIFDTDSDEISYRNVVANPMKNNSGWGSSTYDNMTEYKTDKKVLDIDYSYFPITKTATYRPYGIAPVDDNVTCLKQYNLEKIKSGGEYVLCFKYIPNCTKIENFVKGNVTNLKLAFNTFTGEEICETLDLTGVTDISYLFSYCVNLKKVPNLINCESVNTIEYMFHNCSSLDNIDLTPLQNTTAVTKLNNMFRNCSSLQNIDLSPLQNMTNISDLNGLFDNCYELQSIDLSPLQNMTNISDLSYVFSNCSSLDNIDLTPLQNTTAVSDLTNMFYGCSSLQSIDLSPLQNNNVLSNSVYKGLCNMFTNCSLLESINFGEMRLENITVNYYNTFNNCKNLKYITCTQNMYEILSRTTGFTNLENVTWYIIDREPEPKEPLIAIDFVENPATRNIPISVNTGSWKVIGSTDEDGILYKDLERDFKDGSYWLIGVDKNKDAIEEITFDVSSTSYKQICCDAFYQLKKATIVGEGVEMVNFFNDSKLETIVFPGDCSLMEFENNQLYCTNLQNFENLTTLKAQNLNLSYCKLTEESQLMLVNALLPTETTYTLDIFDTYRSVLAIATAKGYTISYHNVDRDDEGDIEDTDPPLE